MIQKKVTDFFALEGNYPDLDGEGAAARLSAAIRCKTINYFDHSRTDYTEFDKLHAHIKASYPNIMRVGTFERIGHHAVLITIPGSDASLRPCLYMSHQDVVPVVEGTEQDWTHPAFSGDIADGYIWGRGTLDIKEQVFGVLEAAEYLLAHGKSFARTAYLAFGDDEETINLGALAIAEHLSREDVLKITGKVRARGEEAVNPNMLTGEIEVLASSIVMLNKSVTPPFEIEDGIAVAEETRMKWRYMDLRRPEMYAAIKLRHVVAQAMRKALNERDFIEVETPILANSTPEGARDYIVPSRPNPGKFYALPQSPQQFKQMLMVAGVERYYQIARCFRDEDLRADRQPEFTQVDIEMSFVEGEDVIDMMEDVMKEVLAAAGVEHEFPLQRMQWSEAMDRFGCDRPDIRFGMELVNLTDIVRGCGFGVFAKTVEAGGIVKAINCKGAGNWSRGEIEKLAEVAAANGAAGMAWIAFTDADIEMKGKSPIIKFLGDEVYGQIKQAMDAQPGDLLLFAADKPATVAAVLSALRLTMADRLGVERNGHALLWVVNFPMFKYDEE